MNGRCLKAFNDLFKFYENGKARFQKCVCSEEECDCHYSGTFDFVTSIDYNENRYKTRSVTVMNGIIVSVSPESDWKT